MIKKFIKKLFGKPDTIISFKQGFDLTEMALVTLYQGDKKFNFVFDSGSNRSVIDKNILNQLEYKPLKEEAKIFGTEGIVETVPTCEITFYYKDTPYIYSYLVSDMKDAFTLVKHDTGVTLHGIIGTKFLNDYKYVLDFDELIAYSKL